MSDGKSDGYNFASPKTQVFSVNTNHYQTTTKSRGMNDYFFHRQKTLNAFSPQIGLSPQPTPPQKETNTVPKIITGDDAKSLTEQANKAQEQLIMDLIQNSDFTERVVDAAERGLYSLSLEREPYFGNSFKIRDENLIEVLSELEYDVHELTIGQVTISWE